MQKKRYAKIKAILKFLVCGFGLWFLVFGLVGPKTSLARGYYKDQIGLNVHWALGGFGRDEAYEARLLESKTMWVREHFQTHNFYAENREAWFSRYEEILKKYKENNIQVLAMVAYNETGGKTPPNLEEWRAFLRVLVTRFKGYVKYWEIWNEPDSPDYLKPHNPETYAPILAAAYFEIKSVDPEARVLSAGLASPNPYFAKKLYKIAGDKFDIFSFHVYYCGSYLEEGNTASLETKLDQVKEIVKANKPGQEAWITELGCSQNGGRVSQKQQSDYFKYVIPRILTRDFVNKIFIYNIRDYDYWTTYENEFGITSLNLEPKLSFSWYKNIKIGPYGAIRLSASEEDQKSSELISKLENYFGKKNVPTSSKWLDLLDAYVYGDYPDKAIAQFLRFSGKTVHFSIPYSRWRKAKSYKDYIARDWYSGKLIFPFTYKKPRLPREQEEAKAAELKHKLKKKYRFDKLRITKKNWIRLLNAFIYGGYPVEAIARGGKFYGKVVHPKIPYERWKQSSVYKFYIKQRVYR